MNPSIPTKPCAVCGVETNECQSVLGVTHLSCFQRPTGRMNEPTLVPGDYHFELKQEYDASRDPEEWRKWERRGLAAKEWVPLSSSAELWLIRLEYRRAPCSTEVAK